MTVRINGIDVSRAVRSIVVKEDAFERIFEIELVPELQSESGSAHRHIKGLKKAKN